MLLCGKVEIWMRNYEIVYSADQKCLSIGFLKVHASFKKKKLFYLQGSKLNFFLRKRQATKMSYLFRVLFWVMILGIITWSIKPLTAFEPIGVDRAMRKNSPDRRLFRVVGAWHNPLIGLLEAMSKTRNGEWGNGNGGKGNRNGNPLKGGISKIGNF